HPLLQSVRKRIELTEQLLAQPANTSNETDKGPRDHLDPIELYVLSLKQELQDIEMSERLLKAEFDVAYAEAKNQTNNEVQAEMLHGDITRTNQLFSSIVTHLQEVDLVRG